MSETDLPPIALRTIAAITDDLQRALGCVEQAQQVAQWIAHDHYTDPVERSAVAVITTESRHVAELWRHMLGELADAAAGLGDAIHDLDDLSDPLDDEVAP